MSWGSLAQATGAERLLRLHGRCLVFVAMGVAGFLSVLVQQYCFGYMGQKLTRRLRERLFSTILRQVRPALPTRRADKQTDAWGPMQSTSPCPVQIHNARAKPLSAWPGAGAACMC